MLFYIYDCWHKTSIRLCWNRKKSKLSMIVGIPNLSRMQGIAWISLTALLEPLPNKEYSTPVQFLWSITLWNCFYSLGINLFRKEKTWFFLHLQINQNWFYLARTQWIRSHTYSRSKSIPASPSCFFTFGLPLFYILHGALSVTSSDSLHLPVFSLKFKCFHSYHCT
jgi:hypothetical protein